MFKRVIRNIFYLIVLISITNVYPTNCRGAANYPLEIIQPRAGLDTKNRFYKAYPYDPAHPELVYNVRAAVIGGVYPYKYSLTQKPSENMTIDQSTGVINWSMPPAGGPFNVTLSVTDSENTTVAVSWTITVTTTGFLFVDSVNGHHSSCNGCTSNCGTGTINNPMLSMADFFCGNTYASKTNSSYANNFVYWRGGTYYLDAYIENGYRVPIVNNFKPQVWLAYPGETPIIDYQDTNNTLCFYGGNSNIYLDGLDLRNTGNYGIQVESETSQPGATLRRMKIHDVGPTSGANNQSLIDVGAGGQSNYLTIQDNELYNLDHGAAIKLYQTNKFLIEDNYIHDITDSLGGSLEGIALKQDITRGTVRHNRIYNVPYRGVGGNMNSQNWTTQNNEILFNHIWGNCSSGNAIEVNQNGNAATTYYYRNTLECPIAVLQSGPGPFYITNNVIQSNSPQIRGTTANVVENESNLKGTSGIVDLVGNLTSIYSIYLGNRGWQLNSIPFINSGQACDDNGQNCRSINFQ
jgi:hypothetical protein